METTIMNPKKLKTVQDLTVRMLEKLNDYEAGRLAMQDMLGFAKGASTVAKLVALQIHHQTMVGSQEPLSIMSSRRTLRLNALPSEPPRTGFTELVVKAIMRAESPLTEREVGQRMIDAGDLPPNHFDNLKPQPGGPYAMVRGTLIGMQRAGKLELGRNEDGMATYAAPKVIEQ